ncbi:unnamed protein product [Dibothriocephalus latus]|uniref:Uncharacterized protein n=1 Tax=Dibothriocephalus latus TaxID=60516 RepID=A0A3P7LAN2_DIBLA|nr:unnamed protein product [Dibothriocephalus latus]
MSFRLSSNCTSLLPKLRLKRDEAVLEEMKHSYFIQNSAQPSFPVAQCLMIDSRIVRDVGECGHCFDDRLLCNKNLYFKSSAVHYPSICSALEKNRSLPYEMLDIVKCPEDYLLAYSGCSHTKKVTLHKQCYYLPSASNIQLRMLPALSKGYVL